MLLLWVLSHCNLPATLWTMMHKKVLWFWSSRSQEKRFLRSCCLLCFVFVRVSVFARSTAHHQSFPCSLSLSLSSRIQTKTKNIAPTTSFCFDEESLHSRILLYQVMPVYNFKKMAPVPSASDFVDIVLTRTQRKTPTVVHPGYKITRIRSF